MSLDTCTQVNFVYMGKLCIALLSSYILSYVYVAKLCLLYITHAIYVHTYLYIHGLCGVCEQMISSLWIWVGLLEPLHTQLVTPPKACSYIILPWVRLLRVLKSRAAKGSLIISWPVTTPVELPLAMLWPTG